jgi:RNA polymerase sigma factor (sigma-70 family)
MSNERAKLPDKSQSTTKTSRKAWRIKCHSQSAGPDTRKLDAVAGGCSTVTAAAVDTLAPLCAKKREWRGLARDGSEALVREAMAGDLRAREQLLEDYLPVIRLAARKYEVSGLESADLIQEGYVGLLRALTRYDPNRGVPFGAYARWWIRQALQEARCDFVRPFRMLLSALRQLASLKNERDRFYAAEHREPSRADLCAQLALNEEQIDALLLADKQARSLSEPVENLNQELGTLGDLVEDPLSGEAYERVLDSIVGKELRDFLGCLSARDCKVISDRLGINGQERTLREIGEDLGISVERVRQIEERALAKLQWLSQEQ